MLVEFLLDSPVLKSKDQVRDSKATNDRHRIFKDQVRDSKATEDRQRIFQMFSIQKGVCFCNYMPPWVHL